MTKAQLREVYRRKIEQSIKERREIRKDIENEIIRILGIEVKEELQKNSLKNMVAKTVIKMTEEEARWLIDDYERYKKEVTKKLTYEEIIADL